MTASRVLRIATGVVGVFVAIAGFFGARDPLASMASYTAALMALNQFAPPLLLMSLPRTLPWPTGLKVLFDPIVALMLFGGLSVAVSVPRVLDPTLANALYAAPLGVLELLAGVLFWAQLAPATRSLRPWQAALLGWAGSLPMAAVAVVWMMTPNVLYTPYLDVICRWDVPPLLDQKWAGFVMLVSGVPLQLASAWLLLGLGPRQSEPITTDSRSGQCPLVSQPHLAKIAAPAGDCRKLMNSRAIG